MTEEIKVQQTAEQATSAVPAGHQTSTVTARQGADRRDKSNLLLADPRNPISSENPMRFQFVGSLSLAQAARHL
jgi:hypothetical protein